MESKSSRVVKKITDALNKAGIDQYVICVGIDGLAVTTSKGGFGIRSACIESASEHIFKHLIKQEKAEGI